MGPTDRTERMSTDEFVERLKSLIIAHAAGSNQLLTRFSHFVQEASQAVGSAPTRERTDAQTMLSRWLDFNLASYSVMSTSSLALLNGLLAAAESTLIPKPAPAPATGPSQATRVDLRLSGRHGERATSAFALENHFDLPLTVMFEWGDLVSESGSSLPASHLSFEPASPVIPPHGQAVVQAAVSITKEFTVGQTYTTTIRLLGSEAKEIGLSITILPPMDADEPVDSPPELSKSAKRRRTRA
jgi:hypothetical protein